MITRLDHSYAVHRARLFMHLPRTSHLNLVKPIILYVSLPVPRLVRRQSSALLPMPTPRVLGSDSSYRNIRASTSGQLCIVTTSLLCTCPLIPCSISINQTDTISSFVSSKPIMEARWSCTKFFTTPLLVGLFKPQTFQIKKYNKSINNNRWH